jgi:hypothetical protein
MLLALVAVATLATTSLALAGATPQPLRVAFMPTAGQLDEPAPVVSQAPPANQVNTTTNPAPSSPPPAQNGQAVTTDQTPQTQPVPAATDQAQPAELQEEPLPELVVDKTPLTDAMLAIDQALEQAKLAVTALDVPSQQRYIQETINLLAGSSDASFRPLATGAGAESYKGVRPLLIQARVTREAAEVQWIAAVQRQLDARAKKMADLAQVGSAAGTVPPPAPSTDLSATVGSAGVLGTRGVRVEEQATELVSRAIRQAADALRLGAAPGQPGTAEVDTSSQSTDQASQMMDSAVKMLESAKQIIQIAIDR